jgi:hypothetical protein
MVVFAPARRPLDPKFCWRNRASQGAFGIPDNRKSDRLPLENSVCSLAAAR